MDFLGVTAEMYYEDYAKLVDINRNKVDASDPDYVMSNGDSYGLDISAKYDIGAYYLTADGCEHLQQEECILHKQCKRFGGVLATVPDKLLAEMESITRAALNGMAIRG